MALHNPGNLYKYLLQCCKGGYWSPYNILTRSKPWNFITGSRSVGKSTGIALYCLLDYIVNGHKFVYSRRTKDEMLVTCGSYYGDAVTIINKKSELKIADFYYEGGYYYIRMEGQEVEEECGRTIPMSLEHKYKSINLSDVFNVVYDEFIAKDASQYLGNSQTPRMEYTKVLSLFQTIDRGIDTPYRNETRFFFAGNTATIYNPLFLSVGIAQFIDERAKFISPKHKLWVLERVDYVEALGDITESFAYQLADEEERRYAFENRGADETSFIAQPNDKTYYDLTVILNGIKYGISHNMIGEFYVTKPRESGKPTVSLDLRGHDGHNDLKLVWKWRQQPIIAAMARAYENGDCFFYNGKCQHAFLKYLKYMP